MEFQWRKIALLVTAYYSVMILQGCCRACPPSDFPFFEYKSLEIETYGPYQLHPDAPFRMVIRPDETELVTSALPVDGIRWSIASAAYACDCPPPGEEGAKYAITSVNIYSDSIFNASIPAGEPLNELFETAPTDLSGKSNFLPLESVNNDDGLFPRFNYETDEIFLRTYALPVSFGRPYVFEIEIIREDGSVIRGITEPVVWRE